MIIATAEVRPYEIALRRTMESAAGSIKRRHGFIVRLTDEAGHIGYGEASPAEWLGGETLSATHTALEVVPELVGKAPGDLGPFVDAASECAPSAACALDTARLDLDTRGRGMLLTELLGGRARSLPVAALVSAQTPEDVAASVRELVDGGYRCVKIKVGARDLQHDVDRVSAIRRAGGGELSVRLDANQAWTLEQAHRALAAFEAHRPDFVEEPLVAEASAEDWRRLREGHGVPLATDESIQTAADVAPLAGAADVVVVKAARVGGPTASMLIGAAAKRAGMRVVVTDSIECSVGRALAIHLAAALHEGDEAVGLGGAMLLREDPLPLAPAARPRVQPIGPGLGL